MALRGAADSVGITVHHQAIDAVATTQRLEMPDLVIHPGRADRNRTSAARAVSGFAYASRPSLHGDAGCQLRPVPTPTTLVTLSGARLESETHPSDSRGHGHGLDGRGLRCRRPDEPARRTRREPGRRARCLRTRANGLRLVMGVTGSLGRTYAGVDGDCPLATYLGAQGLFPELSLRPGVQHSARETQYNFERVIPIAQRLS